MRSKRTLLVVRDESLADGLADGVDLGDGTTARDLDTDVNGVVAGGAEDHDGLEDLGTEGLVLDRANGLTVDLDEAGARLAVSDRDGGLLLGAKKADERENRGMAVRRLIGEERSGYYLEQRRAGERIGQAMCFLRT
jgi:hypothetical protein